MVNANFVKYKINLFLRKFPITYLPNGLIYLKD